MKRVPRYRYLTLAGVVLLAAGALTPAWAQADPDDVKRGVARISVIGGEVSVQRGDSGEWVAAVVNAPLLAGDQIAVGPDSRAEVQFDAAHSLRLGGGSELRIADLQYGRYQLELAAGTVTHRVLRPSDVDVELDTPNLSVRPSREGAYRITVNGDETTVTARAGDVEIFTPTGSQWLRNGQTMVARGASSDPEFQIVRATPRDEWDRWNDERDRVVLASRSYQHVPQGVYGVEDLDGHGNWDYVPDYGYCWRPTVAVDWAPYSAGRWAWSDWYGWTWVSYDPWGWAPYHYGRWFHRERFGWYWYPGVMSVRHYWSPALVAFIGWGGGGISFGLGNIGWVPLAPYDVFHPWWGRHYYGRPGYFNRSVNIVNVNVVNVYRNARYRNAITGMRGDDFHGGRFGRYTRHSGNDLRDVRAVRGPMPVAPGRAHLNYSDRQVRNVPRTSQNDRFVRRQEPARVERISFSQQQNAFERAGMPVRGGRVAAGGAGGARESRTGGGRESGQGIGGNGGARQAAAAEQPRQNQSGNWRRFGAPSGNQTQNTRGQGQSRPERNAQQPETRNEGGQGAAGRSSWRRFGVGDSNPANSARPGRTSEAGGSGPTARGERTNGAGAPGAGARGEQSTRPNEGGASERPANTPSRGSWQRFGTPEGGSQAPRNNLREAAPQPDRSWSRFGDPGVTPGGQRQQSAPPEVRNEAPRQSAPERRTERPSAAPSAPRNSGGGAFSAPRSGDGGGSMSAPRRSVDRGSGGGFSAPRSSGGGGGGFSAPRTSGGMSVQRGGGGGGSAPRSAPSGNRSGGGGNRGPRGR